nr:X-linked retinitis pigmentosa GTPase regulator-interacting protein 1 [Pogona vitticeps]
MSVHLLDETAGDLPVRDTSQKPSVTAAIRDVSSSALLPVKSPGLKTWTKGSRSLARTRRQINRVSRTELEDGFLRLHDENLLLKEFARKQEDRIKRTHSLVLAELELDPESLSSARGRETDPESSRSQQLHLEAQERRAAIRDNLELIRLQKLLRAKNSELVAVKVQFTGLQEAYETQLQQNQEALSSASGALLAQVEELSTLLREETRKVAALESQIETLSPLQEVLKEFQERVSDLEAERDLLKMNHDKLLESCISTAQEKVDEPPQKDNTLEEQLTALMTEKRNLEQQLENERARNEELEQETKQRPLGQEELEQEMKQRPLGQERKAHPWQEKGSHLEERKTSMEKPPSPLIQQPGYLNILEREDEKEEMPSQKSLKRKLHETEAAHAETVLELEKTRDMLILQHRINRDYQAELEGMMLQVTREKEDHEEKEQQMARLLDLRSARIRQLEEQLKDVAYGTKTVPFRPEEGGPSTGAEPDQAPKLRSGENLFEIHISGAVLSAEALHLLGDPEPVTFCTYSFYDFETHCTPMAWGGRPRYNFTSQYVVQAEPLFLQYLQGATMRLELHLASATDHTTLASGWLHFGEALGGGQQVYATAALHGPHGEDYGLLEYWMRLRFPIDQTLRLHRQRAKALGYLSAGVPRPAAVHEERPQQQEGGRRPGWNELHVRIEGCAGLRSRWLGAQPSPYAVYKFFTFPDHDTVIVPSSNNPHFGDRQSFALCATPELHHYLLLQSLGVYVFDDEDEEPGSYLGKAHIPLVPLAQGRSITGDFVLTDPMGKPNGSIRLSLEWKLLYRPPEEGRLEALQEQRLAIQEKPALLKNQIPRETRGSPLLSSQQRKKPRLYPPKAERKAWKPTPLGGPDCLPPGPGTPTVERAEDRAREDVEGTVQEVSLEELREEAQDRPAVEEETMAGACKESDSTSSAVAEEGPLTDIASEEPESTSDDQKTESDEVVLGMSEVPDLQLLPSNRIRVEIISLRLHPESDPVVSELIQQLYVEYHFPGVPLEETETPFSLRKPQGGQEVYFHFSKVINLDPDPDSLQRRLLFSMLDSKEPQQNRLQFVVVSEPLPGAGGECEDVGFASLDLREILLTGRDAREQELPVLSPFDPDVHIGALKVSTEAAAALSAVYYASQKNSRNG